MGTMRGARRAGACAAAALGMASLCSAGAGAAQTAAQAASPAVTLLRRSLTALGHAPTVIFSGYVPNGKQRIGILARSADHGRYGSGHMAFEAQAFSFVRIGTTYYIDANERFLAANVTHPSLPKVVLKALAGRWVRMPESATKSWASSFAPLTDPAKLASALLSATTGSAAARKGMHFGPMTQVRGIAARTIVQGSGRIAIAAKGAPLPLEMVGPKASSEALTFSYPKSLHITAPKDAVTLAQAVKEASKQGAAANSLRYRAGYAHFSAAFPGPPKTRSVPASFGNYHMHLHLALFAGKGGPVEVGEEDIAPALPNDQVKPALVAALRSFATSGLTMTSQPVRTTYRSYEAYITTYTGGGHTVRVMSFMANNARLYLLVGPRSSFSALKASFRVTK